MSDNYTVPAPDYLQAQKPKAKPPEKITDRLHRIGMGSAYAMMPKRIAELPHLWHTMARHCFRDGGLDLLPEASWANDRADGACGLFPNMTVERLMEGYRRGIYPFAHVGPFKFFAPPQRHVLSFEDFKIEKGTRKLLRRGEFRITFDQVFDEVVLACKEPRAGKKQLTWLRPEMVELYGKVHRAGYAHSVEAWDKDGNLAGGAFGVAVGGVFLAESQFYRTPNASKCAYAVLNRHLHDWGLCPE